MIRIAFLLGCSILFSGCKNSENEKKNVVISSSKEVETFKKVVSEVVNSNVTKESIRFGKVNIDFFTLVDTLNSFKSVDLFHMNKKLCSHTLFKDEGDCSSSFLELGSCEIDGENIIFYSFWCGADKIADNLIPFGAKIQKFKINEKGGLTLIKAEVYKEDFINGERHRGIEILYSKPKSKREDYILGEYITYIEKKENAHFVDGDEKLILIQKVKDKLKDEINFNTKYWKEVYGKNLKI